VGLLKVSFLRLDLILGSLKICSEEKTSKLIKRPRKSHYSARVYGSSGKSRHLQNVDPSESAWKA